jgi:hypothetical protein
MEAELRLPRSEPETEARPAEEAAPKLASNRSRCPYCHEEVRVERADWVACEGCLARHHRACWSERGSCAACHSQGALDRGRARRRLALGLAGLALVGLGALGGVALRPRPAASADPDAATVLMPVASRELARGSVVSRTDFALIRIPRGIIELTEGAVSDPARLVGATVEAGAIEKGQLFQAAQFRRVVVPGDEALIARAATWEALRRFKQGSIGEKEFATLVLEAARGCDQVGCDAEASVLRDIARIGVDTGADAAFERMNQRPDGTPDPAIRARTLVESALAELRRLEAGPASVRASDLVEPARQLAAAASEYGSVGRPDDGARATKAAEALRAGAEKDAHAALKKTLRLFDAR